MSRDLFFYSDGSGQSVGVRVLHLRWGGGADHGKYHVFLVGIDFKEAAISHQCVVDDFGNLVRVS